MVTEAEWDDAQARTARFRRVTGYVGVVAGAALLVPAMVLGETLGAGLWRFPIASAAAVVLLAPPLRWLVRASATQQQAADEVVRTLARDLAAALRTADREVAERDVRVARQRFERDLSDALDMAETEGEVIGVIERAFGSVLPGASAELLLADDSQGRLVRMAAPPGDGGPGCRVDSPQRCPAARRAQVQRFADSDSLDACPKLRDRPEGKVAAVCVPVSVMGRTVGVIHATTSPATPTDDGAVTDLGSLAKLAGARIGLLRVMAETQLQASTDSLTGMLNRRSFEEKVASLRRTVPLVAVAMADLDHFKKLNDTYGHDTGDRALRLFAEAVRASVRALDVAARRGGEEFVVAFPGCTAAQARHPLNGIRARLDAAITVAGLPPFTVSIGVVDAGEHEDLGAVLARADAALFAAKERGRDQVVVHDTGGAVVRASAATDERLPADAPAFPSRMVGDAGRRP